MERLRELFSVPSACEEALLREQYRSLTRLVPVMYGAVLVVVALLARTFHATTPVWLNTYAPGAMGLVVIWRTIHWIRAGRNTAGAAADDMVRGCRNAIVLGSLLSFGFSVIGLFLMQYGDVAQQTLAILLIWILAIVSSFCLYSVPLAALSVVVAATVPMSVVFALNEHPIVSGLVPVFATVTALIAFIIGEIFSNFAMIVRSNQVIIANEARTTHLAYHDALTGLPNRLMLTERLARALDSLRCEGQAFAVHCIDLDQFKEVNDRFGHEAGDDLIRAASFKLAAVCASSDTIARLGGDEFVIIQLNATPGRAAALAAQLVAAMEAPIDIAVGRMLVGCSIGVNLVEDAAVDGMECLRRADLGLYAAKNAGRGQFAFFGTEMDTRLRDRCEIRNQLREALERDELTLVYQPQFENGALCGVEALARWKHPTLGEVSPAVFVPIAEEAGLIEALGEFSMRRAFEDSGRLRGLRVAVNISAAEIRSREFLHRVETLIQETGVDPSKIELEITESLLLGDDPRSIATLQHIRALGFRVALDDFGTGYSNLSYLQRYPIDKIKIDRSFVVNLGVQDGADAVVGAIVRLARALRLDVIAEGVETEAQRLRLAAVGCGAIQGFLSGKPMPLWYFEQLLGAPPARGNAATTIAQA